MMSTTQSSLPGLASDSPLIPEEPNFIEVEKNIIALGFFTPSSCRILTDKKKTISTVRYFNGEKIETTSTILPSAYYGLPVTADQDKYFALQKIIQQERRRTGLVPDPVGFTSADLLRILGVKKNGKNYDDVEEWMKRMTATTITAKLFFAGRKVWVDDTFHVFDRVALKGMDLGDGRIATMNYIWLSQWQRDNIAANYELPIDFDVYCRLRNHIAKALVPLLQIWLYTSMRTGRFEKSYTAFCQLLNIRQYEHLSKIRSVLAPSFSELTEAGYIASWAIEPRTAVQDFKISVTHGPKFFADRQRRAGLDRARSSADFDQIHALGRRGISEPAARQLLATIPDDQPIVDQLEWGDYLIQTARAGTFRNPAGFYVYLLRNAVLPPRHFETSRVREARRAQIATGSQMALKRLELENDYAEYRQRAVEESRNREYPADKLEAKLSELKGEIRRETPEADDWLPIRLHELAMQRLSAEIARKIPLLTFEEFADRRPPQPGLFEAQSA
jgi:hypothetical protein